MPLVRGHYPTENPDWVLSGKPTVYRTNISRLLATSDTAVLTTQVMTSVALPLQAGDVVTNLTFKAGATAAGTPTNWWFALYDVNGNLLAQTADQLTAAWAADATKTLALTTPQTALASGVYYAGVMVKATTPNSLIGITLPRAALSTGILAADKILGQTSGSALTTTAPPTIATPTAVVTVPLVVAT